MHKYLRAVGFSKFNTKKQVDDYLSENVNDTCLESSYQTIDNRLVGQFMLKVCPNAGVSVVGEEIKKKTLVDYYFPFVKGTDYTIVEECTIERQSDREAYLGIIDDYRLGSSLIFYLINSNAYSSHLKNTNLQNLIIDRVYLSALSIEGHIILPSNTKEKAENKFSKNLDEIVSLDTNPTYNPSFDEEYESSDDEEVAVSIGIMIPNQGNLRNGALARVRSNNEDIYSIVDTSIIPCGIECDKYNVVAEIISVTYRKNLYTNENLVEMRVNALGLAFNIMINEEDLIGEPLPGRRFVGSIWLLGEIDFYVKEKLKKKEELAKKQ